MMERKLTCIICPKGCELIATLDENGKFLSVTGHTCKRGAVYAETECTAPTRTLTSTVMTASGKLLPVKTAAPIPKGALGEAMAAIHDLTVSDETRLGDVVLEDVAGTGVSIVAADDAATL